MNSSPVQDKDTFSFKSFELFCESAYNRTPEELTQYLESAAVKKKFTQRLTEIFEPHESNPIEAWTRAKITSFKSDNSPVTNELTEMMNAVSKSTNVSIFKVYQYIDDLKRANPAVTVDLQKPGFLAQSQVFLENLVVENFHQEKMAYLKGLNSIASMAVDNSGDERSHIASQFIADLILNHDFFSNMLVNCRALHNEKASDYMRKNPDLYAIGKLKEQYIILNIVYKLLANGKVLKQAENEFEGFFRLFLEQKFAGIISAMNDDVFVNTNTNTFIRQLAEDTSICQLFISLAFLFSNVALGDDEFTSTYLKYLANVGEKAMSLISEHESLASENPKLAFYSVTCRNYLKVVFEMTKHGPNNAMARLENLCVTETSEEVINYSEHLDGILLALKTVKSVERNDYRRVLKQILDLLWLFGIEVHDVNLCMFRDEFSFEERLLALFKEVMKNDDLLAGFWGDEEGYKMIHELVENWLAGFPFYTSAFIRTAEVLLGSGLRNYADMLVEVLSSLEKITLEVSATPPHETDTNKKNTHFKNHKDVYFLTEAAKIHEEFVLSKDTSFIIKSNGVHVFKVNANLWEFFIRNMFKHLNSLYRDNFLAPSLHFYEYLRLLCKFLICNPNTAAKIEGYSTGDQFDTGVTQVAFILMNSLRILYENPNEVKTCLLIVRALKSLVLSHEGEFVKFFVHAHAIFVHESGELVHPINEIYKTFAALERDADVYKANEKHALQLLEEGLGLVKLLVVDDDFWLSALKMNISAEVPVLVDKQNERQAIDEAIRYVSQYYQSSVFEDAWTINALQIHENVIKVFRSRSLIQNTMIDSMLDGMILPLCTRFIKDDFDTIHENIKLKFKIYSALFDLLNVIYSKFVYSRAERTVWLGDVKEDLQNVIYRRLVEYTKKIPLKELVSESFEVLLDTEVLQNKRFDRLKRKIGVENKHYVVNVVQKNSRSSLRSIKAFLSSALRLLNTSLKITASVIGETELATSTEFVSDIFRSFCVRDTQLKYAFNNFADHHEVSIVISLISLLDLDTVSSAMEPYISPYKLMHCDWNIAEPLFDDVNDANRFVFILDVDTLFAKGINNNSSYRATQNLTSLVFDVLNNIVKLWDKQKRSGKPALLDYILGLYNELPVKSTIWHSFILYIHSSLHARVEQTLDFLLECCNSQFSLIERIIKTEEVELGTSAYNKFFDCLRAIIVNVRQDIGNRVGDIDVNNRIIGKTIILCIQLFQSNKLGKGLLSRHWNILTDTIVNGIFDYIQRKNQGLQSVEVALYQYLEEESDAFTGMDQASHSVNLNLLRSQCYADEELLFDQMVTKFLELFTSNFIEKVLRGTSPLFDGTSRRDLVKRLKGDLTLLLANYINNGVITSDLMVKRMLYQVIPNTISDINKVCSQHNNTFLAANQRSFSRQAYYVDLSKDQTQETYEHVFNPRHIYYILQLLEMPQGVTERLYVNTFIYNALISVTMSKQQIQPKLVHMVNIINSVGVTGNISSCAITPLPFIKTEFYVKSMYEQLLLSEDPKSKLHNEQLLSEINQMFFTPEGNVKTHLNLSALEKSAVTPFWNENNRFNSIIEIYGEGISISTNYENLNKDNVKTIMGSVKDKVTYISSIVSDYIGILRSDVETNYTDLISSESNWKTLLDLLSSYLTLNAHLVVNFKDVVRLEDAQQTEQLRLTIGFLVDALGVISSDRNAQDRVAVSCFKAMHMAIYTLRQFKGVLKHAVAVRLMELAFSHARKTSAECEVPIKIIEWLCEMTPRMLDTSHISYFASRLTLKTIALPEYRAIVNLFINVASKPENFTLVYNSRLIGELSHIESIKSSPNYKNGQFYENAVRDDCHVRFCYLLQLLGVLINSYVDQPNFIKECFYFLMKYQPRFEMLFSLGVSAIDPTLPVGEINANFKTLAYLDELYYALPLLVVLTKEADLWYRESPNLYALFLNYMANNCIRVFSHDPLVFGSNVRSQDGGIVYDKFKPVDTFEKLLTLIQVNATSETSPMRAMDSISRMQQTKSSVTTEIQQFNIFKNMIMNQSSFSNSLFNNRVETLSQICLFQLLTAIINLLEGVDYQTLLTKHGNIFSEETLRRLANYLNGCQLYLTFSRQRTVLNIGNFKQTQMHLILMHNTVEGYLSTCGLATGFPLLSIEETMQVIRKTFDIAYYLQVLLLKVTNETDIRYKQYYSDSLFNCKEKSKIVLAEFMRAGGRPGDTQSVGKDSKASVSNSAYKTLHKYSPFASKGGALGETKKASILVDDSSIVVHQNFLDKLYKLFKDK